MQYKNTKTKRKMIIGTIISIAILFALVSTICGYHIQIAISIKNDDDGAAAKIIPTGHPSNQMLSPTASSISIDKVTKLVLTLRDLWTAHTEWTRNYIISFIAGLPDTNFVAQRLLQNQQDIGNAIKPYYGNEAGNKLTSLLKNHIMGSVDLLKAARAGNTSVTAAAEKKWYENADQIAMFLSSANPNWSKESLKSMLDNHLALTKSEAVARLTGNYAADINAYDKIHQEANVMSDALVDGIVKQFHDKFLSNINTTPITTIPHKTIS